jgi:hypothetical protein
VKRRVVLHGGPLDGHLHDIDDRQQVAYVIHNVENTTAPRDDVVGKTVPVVLVYKRTGGDAPKWVYLGPADTP